MSTKLGLVSDIHADPAPLKEALSLFKQQKVNDIFCPGDIGGYGESLNETVELLIESQCQSILGNHEIWHIEKFATATDHVSRYFKSLPHTLDLTIEGKSLYMVHASPPDSVMEGIRLLDQEGVIIEEQRQAWSNYLNDLNHDVLIVGHTHQVFAEQLGKTLVINPGSSTYNHSCAILNLPEMTVEFYSLSGQEISKTWNWGDQVRTPN